MDVLANVTRSKLVYHYESGVVKGLKDISLTLGKDKLAGAREKTLSFARKKIIEKHIR